MSIREYNSIIETEYLLSSRSNHERLLKGIKQAEEGNLLEVDTENLLM